MRAGLPRHAYTLVAGQSVSVFGDYAARTALMLFLLDRTGSAFSVGLMMIVNSLPAILGVSAGYLSDRFSPKSLLVVYSLSGAALSLTMIGFTRWAFSIAAVYPLYFLLALSGSLFAPTRMAFIAEVVADGQLKRFNSLDQTMEAVVMAVGIMAAGYLYSYLGIGLVFGVNAVTFLAVAVAFAIVPGLGAARDSSRPAPARRGLRGSLAVARGNPALLFLTLGVGISGLAVGIFSTMFVVYVRMQLGGTNIDFSQLASLRALVSAAVGFLIVLSVLKIDERVMIVSGYLAMGASIMAMSLTTGVGLVYVWSVAVGAANVIYYIATRTMLQRLCGKEARTHLFALQAAIMRFCLVLGSGLSGIVADWLGIRPSVELLIAGLIFVAIGGWAVLALRAAHTGRTAAATAGE